VTGGGACATAANGPGGSIIAWPGARAARLSYRRAEALFRQASGGWTLHQLRHSPLMHLAEQNVSLPLLMAKSRHASLRSLQHYAIIKTFVREDFAHAMTFVNGVAGAAEAAGHHPDIDIRWNKVALALSSRAEGGLTDRDFQLAARIQELDQPAQPAPVRTSQRQAQGVCHLGQQAVRRRPQPLGRRWTDRPASDPPVGRPGRIRRLACR
jgi:4a-hydroxytetrahydrobiopterin dehydratase